jgi:hypothetical protein
MFLGKNVAALQIQDQLLDTELQQQKKHGK